MAKIAILGCGFGLALAVMTDKSGHEVSLWSRREEEVEEIKNTRQNIRLLPEVYISDSIFITNDLSCVRDKDIVIIAVPSVAMRDVAKKIAPFIGENTVIVSVAKGFDNGTLKTMSEVLGEELPNPIVVLSGPSHAEEIANDVATTVVAASKSKKHAKYIQHTLSNNNFRIYTNDDLVGVELGGALKNVIALAAGILDGLELGDNAKAALMTRGLSEMATLGLRFGARKQTFAGLAGIGDLIVTCTSRHSRNHQAGYLIGKGKTPMEAIAEVGKTVEGYTATLNAYALMKQTGVAMPITEQIYNILYKSCPPKTALSKLMTRPFKDEAECTWLD